MRTMRVLAAGAAAITTLGMLMGPAGGAEGDDASFAPNPVLPGGQVTVTITGDNPCGDFGGTFVSNVELSGPGSFGPLVFTGNPGTFTVPAEAPLGLYSANVFCATSANTASGFVRPLLVGTVAIDEPPSFDDPPAADAPSVAAGDPAVSVAAAAVAAAPTVTG